MNKSKRTASLVLVLLLAVLVLLLTLAFIGHSKIVSTEDSTVQVKIVDEYHRNAYMTSVYNGKSFQFVPHSAVYRITVEYKDTEYNIADETTYEKYHDKIGETVNAALRATTWDNGSVTYDIVGLE